MFVDKAYLSFSQFIGCLKLLLKENSKLNGGRQREDKCSYSDWLDSLSSKLNIENLLDFTESGTITEFCTIISAPFSQETAAHIDPIKNGNYINYFFY